MIRIVPYTPWQDEVPNDVVEKDHRTIRKRWRAAQSAEKCNLIYSEVPQTAFVSGRGSELPSLRSAIQFWAEGSIGEGAEGFLRGHYR